MSAIQQTQRMAGYLAGFGLAAMVALACVTIIDILGRELFNVPIDGFSDVGDLIIIAAAAACFPASIANNQHVAVRFAGMLHWRIREGLDALGHLAMLVILALMAWQLGLYTQDLYANGQTTWLLYIPVWPVWLLATFFIVLCVPIKALMFAIKLAGACGKHNPERNALPTADENFPQGNPLS
ncbi:TRAP transporter small permease [Thalassospira marina]|uniref:TRAP transporter small permease protein n=1 Tax=Thalassospira marina TaxID=2048283 RepID=A0ABN5FPG9_9PROT|nr:TRAP transporter small permease subunit [Thalassospira marina]AUG55372.1 hypothetical protein CSC3H3_21070 [Thalassospira marina]